MLVNVRSTAHGVVSVDFMEALHNGLESFRNVVRLSGEIEIRHVTTLIKPWLLYEMPRLLILVSCAIFPIISKGSTFNQRVLIFLLG